MTMTEPRPYRAGLGLPEAVVIRSRPLPENARPILDGPLDPLSAQVTWREWNINPARHGPERMTRPPVFVPSQLTYDELGRSMADGVGVDVDDGIRREVESGQKVSEWYKALSNVQPEAELSRRSSPDRQAVPSSRPSPIHPEAGLSRRPSPYQSEDSLLCIQPEAGPSRSRSTSPPTRPIRVKRSEWFIRRALLKSATSTPTTPSTPLSIGSMLNIGPSQQRVKPAQYVLGPDNKGYTILRDRLGWEGGGLGRPEGYEPALASDDEIVPIDASGNIIIDLTADSDEEPVMRPGGPGRTAPIATALKLDRLGIGHRRSQTSTARKVTHTVEEIEKAQRRARYRKIEKVELGKKGKIKWKDKDKRERDERRRLLSMMHG
ncbi:hypothetical protein BCR39DRAFT_519397 [Naematelia encephala]|uniref:G-patch domain-containing protein n=1 Tax=Naematelia encephala TaxID=71784 RepID=A0A1Y2BET7_9TREE|nr:hypothetical protein BCR39DRAFT_519397 [Naematelia encephala]